MIENPDRFIPDFAKAGASLISVQVETCPHLHRTIHLIREYGCRPGAVLNPATQVSALEWILEDIDFVLIMSVNPGFGGQKFIQSALQKTRDLRGWIQSKNLSTLIEVDGGVNETTILEISDAGVDAFVAGSAIFESPDYQKTISNLKQIISRNPADK
jgi:ribulose-phosphate 3-epimerase